MLLFYQFGQNIENLLLFICLYWLQFIIPLIISSNKFRTISDGAIILLQPSNISQKTKEVMESLLYLPIFCSCIYPAAAKSHQSCPTLCNTIDGNPPGSCPWDSPGKNTGVGCHFLLQCRKVKVKSLRRVQPSATPWTAAHQAPPSMGFPRQGYWSGLPLLSLKTTTSAGSQHGRCHA